MTIVLFWLPLAATWFMMAAEGPTIAAIVARMPEAVVNLAAYGVATSLAWLVESPIMMLLSASTALVRDRASYLALRRFTSWLNALVTIAMALLAIPPVFRFVGERLIGLPPEISRLAQVSTAILTLWPASIGYRRSVAQRVCAAYSIPVAAEVPSGRRSSRRSARDSSMRVL